MRITAVGAPERSSLRILVCDDEAVLVRMLRVFLEQHGHRVTTALDGRSAWEILENEANEFDIALVDVMMPYLDGFELLKRIRANPRTENLIVIMMTAMAQDKDVFEGYHYGADMYLTKPINLEDFLVFRR